MQAGKLTFVEKIKFEKNDAIVLIKFLHKSGMNIFRGWRRLAGMLYYANEANTL
jgi:hypothetical protein